MTILPEAKRDCNLLCRELIRKALRHNHLIATETHSEDRREPAMAKYALHYVTNRGHEGKKRSPDRYGAKFSDSGSENLRFGKLTLDADKIEVDARLASKTSTGTGDGAELNGYFTQRAEDGHIKITPYREKLEPGSHEERQPDALLGSAKMFEDIRKAMLKRRDVVIMVHGYNVSWESAVGTALALQAMLNRPSVGHTQEAEDPPGDVMVVLFTWPSDGSTLPFVAYRSDRSEAGPSGAALGRSLLRLRDYLMRLDPADHCGRRLNILCHSMGNFVLEAAVARAANHVGGQRIPCIFDHVFLCSADVDDDVLEPGEPMGRIHEMANFVNVYYNRGDTALLVSDVTKGNPDRLGSNGAARPGELHHKIHQVDCSDLVTGLVEHDYFLAGRVNEDIRLSIDGMEQVAPGRDRRAGRFANGWRLV
jgi:hypothetical protein